MGDQQSRRSFLTAVLVRAAGGWLVLTGIGASACGGVTKYGGVRPGPEDQLDADYVGGADAKYGGPVFDAGPVVKYGGPPEDDAGPVVKYGGPPQDAGDDDAGPVVKYGGPPQDAGA